jgi:hypothetical protein
MIELERDRYMCLGIAAGRSRSRSRWRRPWPRPRLSRESSGTERDGEAVVSLCFSTTSITSCPHLLLQTSVVDSKTETGRRAAVWARAFPPQHYLAVRNKYFWHGKINYSFTNEKKNFCVPFVMQCTNNK